MKLIFFLAFVLNCNGFLLDSNTETPPSGLDDKRYNSLMDLLMEERRSRKNLEAAVSRELLALRQEVNRCQCNNGNVEAISKNETDKLKSEMLELQNKHKSLELKLSKSEQNNTALTGRVQQLEHELSVMQSPTNFTNAKQLANALQNTNSQLNAITNDVNARKQDFIALYQKLVATEDRLENVSTTLKNEQNKTFTTLHHEILNSSQYTTGKIRILDARQNETVHKLQAQTDKLQQSLDKARDRAILTTCNNGNAVNGVIQFTDIKTINGINSSTSIRSSGIFTCEKSGLYIVSVFIQSNSVGVFYVKKNREDIADAYIATPNPYATSSATVVTQLAIGDTIKVTGSSHVYNSYESCLTIVQIQ